MVVTRLPATAATGSTQLRVATPSKWTVHAPHCAMPQPNFVPVRPSVSRSTQSSGVSGLSVTERDLPLTVNVIGDIGGAPREVRAQESWRGVPSDGRGGGESGCGGAGGAGGGRCPHCIGRALFPRPDHPPPAARALFRPHGGGRGAPPPAASS